MPTKTGSPPSYSVDFKDRGQVSTLHFSPYDVSQNILLVGLPNKILVGFVCVDDDLNFQILVEFNYGVYCSALALSPETIIDTACPLLLFCAAGKDFDLSVFKSDLRDDNPCMVLKGHSGYINGVSYDPENLYIASCSDDNTAKLWSTANHSCVATLALTSPGMSVCWHKEDSSKLLVAEKLGLIRFYNVNTLKPILSLDYGKPLSVAHWAPSDPQLVASLNMGELLIWDLTRSSCPIQTMVAHTFNGGHLSFNSTGELVATVNACEGAVKVVLMQNQQQRLAAQLMLASNPVWHFRLPILCVAEDNKLRFWKVSTKYLDLGLENDKVQIPT